MRVLRPRSLGATCLLLALLAAGCGDAEQPAPDPAPAPVALGPVGGRLGVDQQLTLEGLSAPVDVVRDEWGIVHLYASTPDDAFRAQGFAMARDRASQLEVLRRTATGRLAEVLGESSPDTIDQDLAMRSLGLTQIAQADAATLGSKSRWIEAFADGVDQVLAKIRSGAIPAPTGMPALRASHYEPFTVVDVLAIERLVQLAMSFSVSEELSLQQVVTGVRSTFSVDAEPSFAKRAGILPDLLRFAPADGADTTATRVMDDPFDPWTPRDRASGVALDAKLVSGTSTAVRAWDRAIGTLGDAGLVGSNAWALGASRSAVGASTLVSEPHFRLRSPAAVWLVHLHVASSEADAKPVLQAAGAALVGVPGVAYGFNRTLAWSSASSRFDVTDLYAETLSDDGAATSFQGAWVPLASREERVVVAGGDDIVFDVLVVPHHGPLIPTIVQHRVAPLDPSAGALSVRWLGASPSRELEAMLSLTVTRDAAGALGVMQEAPSAVRSYVFSDASGNIAHAPASRVVRRDPGATAWDASLYAGALPCLVGLGGGSAEWTGALDASELPVTSNPAEGFVVAANADPVGTTFDNDPANDATSDGSPLYLGCSFDLGFRDRRLRARFEQSVEPLTMDDVTQLEGEARSALGARLAPQLVDVLLRAMTERSEPGTYPELSELVASPRYAAMNATVLVALFEEWRDRSDYRAAAGVKFADMLPSSDHDETMASRATLLFNVWLVRWMQRVFADEASAAGVPEGLPQQFLVKSLLHLVDTEPSMLSSYDPDLQDSILWDDIETEPVETRDQQMLWALMDAHDWLEVRLGDQRNDWRWGKLHTVRFTPFDDVSTSLAVPATSDENFPTGFPSAGDLFGTDAATYDAIPSSFDTLRFTFDHGPTMRLAVAMASSGPVASVALAGGEVGAPDSPYFRNGTEYWRHRQFHPFVFTIEQVVSSAHSRTVLTSSK